MAHMVDRSHISRAKTLPTAADLYCDIESAKPQRLSAYFPGLAVAATATMTAAYLSDHYGAPLTLMALLVGLALNFLNTDHRLALGLGFASRTLLRWGIVLVGARITIGQILHLGPVALIAIASIVALTIGSGVMASRRFGSGSAFGILAGGSVAICGASAALALATTLGERRISQAQLAMVLVIISTSSSLAMFLYPILAHHLQLDDTAAGFMLGAAIHDVAQALGAGYSYSQGAGDVAAIVKLVRVAMLAPVLVFIAYLLPDHGDVKPKTAILPWFIVGFFTLAIVNSAGVLSGSVSSVAQGSATALLACAVTATGIRSPMSSLLDSGIRPAIVVTIATLTALILALLSAKLLIV